MLPALSNNTVRGRGRRRARPIWLDCFVSGSSHNPLSQTATVTMWPPTETINLQQLKGFMNCKQTRSTDFAFLFLFLIGIHKQSFEKKLNKAFQVFLKGIIQIWRAVLKIFPPPCSRGTKGVMCFLFYSEEEAVYQLSVPSVGGFKFDQIPS